MFPLVWQAVQSWKSAKAVALLVVLALTVGIGSATAIYTVINTLLLKPIPYEHGERFVSMLGGSLEEPGGFNSLSGADIRKYQQRTRSFEMFGWFKFGNYNLTAPGQPLYLNGVEVTPALANGVGVKPELGQWFRDAGEPAAVISHNLWERLGGDPAQVGKAIVLNGRSYTLTGVMPPSFHLPLAGIYNEAPMDVWLPLDPSGRGEGNSGDKFGYARLRPGVTAAQADVEVKRIAAEIAKRDPDSHRTYTARVDDLREVITIDIKPILMLLFAAAELLVLIMCANVGGLLVARAVARARDTAVRVALGARLRQLGIQYFLEGLVVTIPGTVGGLLFSAGIVRLLVSSASSVTVRISEIAADWRVYAFAAATALIAGALTSVGPLWQATRTMPNEVLSEGVRASASARSRRLSMSLVVAETGLAFVLLSLSSVLLAELARVIHVSPGFDPSHLLTFRLTIEQQPHAEKGARAAYQRRLEEALETIPGVAGVGFVNQLPLNGCCFFTTIVPTGSANPGGYQINLLPVNSGYWQTMRIPLRRGRLLNDRDTSEAPMAVVINQTAANRFWPKQDPVGTLGHFNRPDGDPYQVVGVVGDVKNNGLDNPTTPEVYLPAALVGINPLNFVVRSTMPTATLVPQVRHAIQGVNSGQPIHEVQTMDEIVKASVSLKRVASYVMSFFALAAVLMVTIGTYGVVSYSVRQRTVEIGTRMALGAVGRDVLALVVGSGLKMAAYGIAIGIAGAAAATWYLIRNFDIAVGNGGNGRIANPGILPFVWPTLIVACVSICSSFFPAWWATLLSPMVAIRNQQEAIWQSARERLGQLYEGFSRALWVDAEPPLPESTLATELTDAARRAGSFREALMAGLESLRANTGAESAMLLESLADEDYRSTAVVPEESPNGILIPRRGLLLGRLRPLAAALPITAGDLDTWRRWASEQKPEHLAEIAALERFGARLAVPLRTRDDVVGVLLLGTPAGREQYGASEKRLLRNCAGQFALLLENARLTGRVLEQEKLRRDVALAAEVQRGLLARHSMETAVVSLAAVNVPARSVGGDYYDFLDLGSQRIGIALADVAGKGVAAALIMSVVQASLRVISSEPNLSLPDLAAKMNHFLYRSTGSNSYATFFYAQLDERTRELRYVNAGHNPPYLLRVDRAATVEELATGGTIIGMFPKAAYEEGKVDLQSGDVLAIFTDGVPEAQNPAEEEFGEDRLKALLAEVAHLPVAESSARISLEMKNWIQDAAQYDDLTFVLMKVK